MIKAKYILMVILLAMVISGCKKEDDDPVTPQANTNTNTTTETCSDGIQNQDETGVDCGGVCSACPAVTPPCTQTSNTSNFPLGMQDDTYNTSCSIENTYNNYELLGNGSASDMTIWFRSIPTSNTIYTTTNSTNASGLSDTQAIISTVAGGTFSYLYYADPFQELYVNVNGTTITAEFCSLTFNSASSGAFTDLTVSGFLQCN